jgi:decaprenyl-phosphate phosphoribosyltransferase
MKTTTSAVLALVRPRHWIKNLFVLAPLVFAGSFRDPVAVTQALAAAGLFTVAAVAVYILNDLLDLERDRAHAAKRNTRPLAAGSVSVSTARGLVGVLYLVLAASLVAWPRVAAPVGLYLFINAAYSLWLRASFSACSLERRPSTCP